MKGTRKFLFAGNEESVGNMAGRLRQACGRHHVECFTKTYHGPHLSKGMGITNVRDIFEAETGDWGSGRMQLVSCSTFWPNDSLHERVFGKGHSGGSQDNEPADCIDPPFSFPKAMCRMMAFSKTMHVRRLQELRFEADSTGYMPMMADNASADNSDEEEADVFYG